MFTNLVVGNYYLYARVLEGENYWATSNTAQPTSTVAVEGINENSDIGYPYYYMKIKTSNIENAGTDSVIKGRYHYLDGTSSNLTHFDKNGDDFERGDEDAYLVDGPKRVPWMIKELEIDYTAEGKKPGWHCEYVQPFVQSTIYIFFMPSPRIIEGSPIRVDQWFEADDHNDGHVVWIGSTDSIKREITAVGNFEDLSETMSLNNGEIGSYTFTYDGLVLDQYGYDYMTYEAKSYDAYDYFDAPVLSIEANDKAYGDFIDYNINSVTIDKEALYAAMMAQGETSTTFTVTLQFPERSTTKNTATWTKTITVSIDD